MDLAFASNVELRTGNSKPAGANLPCASKYEAPSVSSVAAPSAVVAEVVMYADRASSSLRSRPYGWTHGRRDWTAVIHALASGEECACMKYATPEVPARCAPAMQ